MRGAGGTPGGGGIFWIGFVMMCAGFYMLLSAVTVRSSFGFRHSLYNVSAFGSQVGVTGGMILVPFVFGIGLIFYDRKNMIGWLLTIGSIAAFIIGVIASVNFSVRAVTAFEFIAMLVLSFGGQGLFLQSLREKA
ncbi:MAG: hypothetical protein ACR2QJ_07740 [Geminicoccaceae bacterium]